MRRWPSDSLARKRSWACWMRAGSMPAGLGARRVDEGGQRLRGFAPGEQDVGVPGGHLARRRRRAAEEDLRPDRMGPGEQPVPQPVVGAGEVEPVAWPGAPEHLQALAGAFVPLVVCQPVAVAALFVRVPAGD